MTSLNDEVRSRANESLMTSLNDEMRSRSNGWSCFKAAERRTWFTCDSIRHFPANRDGKWRATPHRIQCRGLWYAACDIRNMLSSNSTLCFKSKFRGNYKLTKELFVWWINQPVFTFAVVTILQHEDMHGSFGMISSKRKVAKIGLSR